VLTFGFEAQLPAVSVDCSSLGLGIDMRLDGRMMAGWNFTTGKYLFRSAFSSFKGLGPRPWDIWVYGPIGYDQSYWCAERQAI
jgi:hypothetical protein